MGNPAWGHGFNLGYSGGFDAGYSDGKVKGLLIGGAIGIGVTLLGVYVYRKMNEGGSSSSISSVKPQNRLEGAPGIFSKLDMDGGDTTAHTTALLKNELEAYRDSLAGPDLEEFESAYSEFKDAVSSLSEDLRKEAQAGLCMSIMSSNSCRGVTSKVPVGTSKENILLCKEDILRLTRGEDDADSLGRSIRRLYDGIVKVTDAGITTDS